MKTITLDFRIFAGFLACAEHCFAAVKASPEAKTDLQARLAHDATTLNTFQSDLAVFTGTNPGALPMELSGRVHAIISQDLSAPEAAAAQGESGLEADVRSPIGSATPVPEPETEVELADQQLPAHVEEGETQHEHAGLAEPQLPAHGEEGETEDVQHLPAADEA